MICLIFVIYCDFPLGWEGNFDSFDFLFGGDLGVVVFVLYICFFLMKILLYGSDLIIGYEKE